MSECSVTLANFFKQNIQLAQDTLEKAGYSAFVKLDVKSVLDLKLLLNIPTNKFRLLKTFFENKNIKIFPSEPKLRTEMVSRFDNSSITCTSTACQVQSDTSSPNLTVINLHEKVSDAIKRVKNLHQFVEDFHFQNEVWVKFGADKGGTSTKLVFEIANVSTPNSTHNTELISLFEGTDSYENLMQYFGPLRDQFHGLQSVSSETGDPVVLRKFLFGDYHWICDQMGHQGASSSFPCVYCLVSHNSLKARTGAPRTPMIKVDHEYMPNPDCVFPRRTKDMFICDLLENQSDTRNGGNTVKNGKYHNSIVREPLFLVDPMHIAPIPLHISLGLGHRFFLLLENQCKAIDMSNGDGHENGPLYTRLFHILEQDLKICKQAYHSNCFVGNHVAKIFNNAEKLVEVLHDYPEEHARYLALFNKFHFLHYFLGLSRFLTETEIAQYCEACWEFGTWFPKHFPNETIPPKLHILIFHTPEFLKTWKSLGIFGEHGLEALHHTMNEDFRSYNNVKNKSEQLKLMFAHHNMKLTSDPSILNVKCNCGKYFKNSECPQCTNNL